MLTFTGYEKIREGASDWRLDAAGFRALRRVPWAVTEKIHGANFCFVVEEGRVHGANRRRLLSEDEPFFDWQTVRDGLAPALRELAARLVADGLSSPVCVYGELFGGGYPHPAVASVLGVQPIQTGVWYAPGIRFAAFDIAVGSGDARRYLDWERAQLVLAAAGVPHVAPLLVGTYEQATDFLNRFDTRVPTTLGLPPLPPGTNLAEGVVIRSMREIAVTGTGGAIRPLIKRKIAEFAEDKRFHGAEPWSPPAGTDSTSSSALDRLKWEAYCRVTQNRLDAAVSKIGLPGRGTQNRARELFALIEAEIRDEAWAADGAAWEVLTAAGRAEWADYVRGEVRGLLRGRFRR